jgi:hypothetical protein
MGAGMSAFLVYVAWTFLREERQDNTLWLGALILLLAAFVAGLSLWRWRTGRTPLTVERSGRICYGEKVICSPGVVRSIRVVEHPHGEGAYDVMLDLHEGTRLEVPGFAYGSRDNAIAFAQELAAELHVTVVEVA